MKNQNKLTPRTKTKPMQKSKQQQGTYSKLTKAEMKELTDINNQLYTLLNRIDKIPNHILKSMMKS